MDDLATVFSQLQSTVGPLTLFALSFVATLFLIGLAAWLVRRSRRPQARGPVGDFVRPKSFAEQLADRHLADIVQTTAATGFGSFCVVMLVFTWLIGGAQYLTGATVMHQIVGLLIWIGGNTMFGLGAALGRKTTYRVYRSEHREPL